MKLLTFRLNFSPGTELPKKLLVAKWGKNKSVNGDYICNETTARQLPISLKSVNFDTVDLDFEHNTVPGSPTFRAEKEPRKRAAHGPLEVVPGEGIFLHTADRWTPEGSEAVKGGHFNDLSGAILVNKNQEIVFMHSVALARHGATEDLPLQLNSADPLLSLFQDETTPAMIDYKKLLLSVFGLPETANDNDITTAAAKLAGNDAASGQLKTMSADLQKLRTDLDAMRGSSETNAKEAIAARALALGKIIPHSLHELPLAQFEKIVNELPADQVPLDKRTPEGVKLHSSSFSSAASTAEDEVARQMGNTAEKVKKYGNTTRA